MCRKVKTSKPEIKNEMASIASAAAAPKPLTNKPAEAAPRIMPEFDTNAFIAFPFYNASSGTMAGKTPVKAGQKIPHIAPKNPFTKIKTINGTALIVKK